MHSNLNCVIIAVSRLAYQRLEKLCMLLQISKEVVSINKYLYM